MHHEGFQVVAVPKTMDNDVFGTDYCIGFSTAVTRSVDAITNLRASREGARRSIAHVCYLAVAFGGTPPLTFVTDGLALPSDSRFAIRRYAPATPNGNCRWNAYAQ